MRPGEILFGEGAIRLNAGRPTAEVTVTNTSDHTIWVSSHFPFFEVNRRLVFDRAAPHGAYPCAGDDRWIAIACFTDAEWNAFVKVAGHAEWATDARFSTLATRLHHPPRRCGRGVAASGEGAAAPAAGGRVRPRPDGRCSGAQRGRVSQGIERNRLRRGPKRRH
jgi:hypothetical protein